MVIINNINNKNGIPQKLEHNETPIKRKVGRPKNEATQTPGYRKKYNQNYYGNNKDYWKTRLLCETCAITYPLSNKSKHNKSLKHLKLFNFNQKKRTSKVLLW